MRKFIFLLLSLFCVEFLSAQDNIITQTKVSISVSDKEICDVLDAISLKSGVNFTYNSELLKNQKVSFSQQNCEIDKILNSILSDKLTYSVIGGNIVIFEKNEIETEETKMISIFGTIRDSEAKCVLPFATISVNNSVMGTISNENGKFELMVNKNSENDTLVISYLGYEPQKYLIRNLNNGKSHDINLVQKTYGLNEVVVNPIEIQKILKESISKVNNNFDHKKNVYKAFYRESYYTDSSFISRDEAVINILKNSGDYSKNKMSLEQGRKFVSKNQPDVLLIISGGPYLIMDLDFVNRQKEFLSKSATRYYNYNYAGMDSVNGTYCYVINFEKRANIPGINYSGTIFIDKQSKAVSKLEFVVEPDGKELSAKNKKGETIKMVFRRMVYRIKYTKIDEKWFLQSCIGEETRQITDNKGNNTFITSIQQLIITETTGKIALPKDGTIFGRKDLISNVIIKHNSEKKINH
ncbi:MAG: carboxypeptidase-like regulatory domain-containing protein [Bacteroidales bacterium]|nr:carboxypeptidase-like regulatory domain-containing protein [Bacteroidales bacterium]